MLKHGLTLIFAFLLTVVPATAQPPDTLWTATFGGAYDDSAVAVVLTDDGGFVAAGNGAFSILKADSMGAVQWTRSYPEGIADIVQTSDGGFAIAGTAINPDSFLWAPYLSRLDANGDLLWSRQYTDTSFYTGKAAEALAVTPDGGFVLTGTYYNEYMWTNSFVIATNSSGDTLWTVLRGGNFDSDGGHDVQVSQDGVVFIAGHRWPYPSGHYMFGARYSAQGDFLGQILHTESDAWLWANAVAVRPDGSYLLAGSQYSPYVLQTSVYIAHVSAADIFTDASSAGGRLANDEAFDIELTADGGFVTVGFSYSFEGPGTAYIVKFNAAGDMEWQKTVGNIGGEVGYGLGIYPNGDILMVGVSGRLNGNDVDAYFVKLAAPMSSMDREHPLPSSLSLSAYPNPFNGTTAFTFTVPRSGNATLCMFDLLGREVALLKDDMMEAGTHHVIFDGSGLASGIYFARLDAGNFSQTQKLMLLK